MINKNFREDFWEKDFDANFDLDNYGDSKAVQNLVKSFIRKIVAITKSFVEQEAIERTIREILEKELPMDFDYKGVLSEDFKNYAQSKGIEIK